eukprot:184019-Chlamydomonas_euryale.AAC.1
MDSSGGAGMIWAHPIQRPFLIYTYRSSLAFILAAPTLFAGGARGLNSHDVDDPGVTLCGRHPRRGGEGRAPANAVQRDARRVAGRAEGMDVPGADLLGARHPAAAAARGQGVPGDRQAVQ